MDNGRQLLDILAKRFPDSSKTTLRKMLQGDRVRVNGTPERDAKRVITADDRVEVGPRDLERADPRVAILYEDADLVVINKAAELLTVASPTESRDTAEALLNARYGRPVHVVHRLDRDTSGVLVFARNGDMRDRLKELFAAHDLTRIYAAVIHGALRPASGTIQSYLLEDPSSLRVRSIPNRSEGREAVTHYRTLASNGLFSLLDVTLETGRRHQIRVHLAEAGHPVMGDAIYGPWRDNPLGRLGLHARHLSFVHPRSAKLVTFEVPAPPEFAQVVR